MIHRFAKKSAQYFTSNGLIKKSKYEWCIYAIEKRLISLSAISSMLLLGSLIYGWISTVIFIVTFQMLRKNTGGYHANNNTKCFFLSNIILLVSLQGIKWTKSLYEVQVIMLLVSILTLLTLAPVNHPNMHFTSEELAMNKQKVFQKLALAVATIVASKIALDGLGVYQSIIMGLFSVSITVIIAKLTRQEVKQYEKS